MRAIFSKMCKVAPNSLQLDHYCSEVSRCCYKPLGLATGGNVPVDVLCGNVNMFVGLVSDSLGGIGGTTFF